MTWTRTGLAYTPAGEHPWARSHAQLPTWAGPVPGGHRVLFATRDGEQRSHIRGLTLDLQPDGPHVVSVDPEPILAPGPVGGFDDFGVYPASVVDVDGDLYLYYIGWNPGKVGALFYATIGLAVSTDGGATFQRVSRAPVMGRSDLDPLLVTSPCVLRENGVFRMWYVSGTAWEWEDGKLQSFYLIRYAESADGIHWQRDGQVAIGFDGDETNVARAAVVRGPDGGYTMWFCTASRGNYQVLAATSPDGLDWTRQPGLALPPDPGGWEQGATAYPAVLPHGDRLWMLYNGAGYGRDGFGAAWMPWPPA